MNPIQQPVYGSGLSTRITRLSPACLTPKMRTNGVWFVMQYQGDSTTQDATLKGVHDAENHWYPARVLRSGNGRLYLVFQLKIP